MQVEGRVGDVECLMEVLHVAVGQKYNTPYRLVYRFAEMTMRLSHAGLSLLLFQSHPWQFQLVRSQAQNHPGTCILVRKLQKAHTGGPKRPQNRLRPWLEPLILASSSTGCQVNPRLACLAHRRFSAERGAGGPNDEVLGLKIQQKRNPLEP